MTGSPKVSVIIPVHNGEDFLGEAIESALGQTFVDLECIVVDDGSTDGSAAVAKNYGRVNCVRGDRAGVAAARNRGAKLAAGEYLAFLDADDRWDPQKLELQIECMETRRDLGFTLTLHRYFLDGGIENYPSWIPRRQFEEETTAYIPSSLVVRKIDFDFLGGFDESYRVGEDSDWFLRAHDIGIGHGFIERCLVHKRVHPRCLSSQTGLIQESLLRSVKASLRRAKPSGRVSVVIPVYDGEKYLEQALSSVMGQSSKPFEIILVDDGSTDSTAEIIRRYGDRVRYVGRGHEGAAAARNEGARRASGEYIAFLDADDIWEPRKLELQLREICRFGAASMVFGKVAQFHSPETDEAFREKYVCPSEPSAGEHVGTLLMRREDFLKVGFFSIDYQVGEFIEWHQRAIESGMSSVFVPEVVMRRRIHPSNQGIALKTKSQDYARAVVEILRRRGKRGAGDTPR